MRIMAMLLAFFFVASTASALDIPRPKKDKEKKKESKSEEKETKSEPAAKKEEPKEESTAKKEDEKKPAPAAHATESTTEMTLNKEQWDAMKDYAVGDFVVYEFPAQAGMKQRQEVLERTATSITVLHKTTGAGQDNNAKMKYVLKDATEKVTVAGKEFNATKMDMTVGGALQSRTWNSKEVPLGGMLKSEGPGGQVYMQLSEFGKGK